jgi:hypothetical protein
MYLYVWVNSPLNEDLVILNASFYIIQAEEKMKEQSPNDSEGKVNSATVL